MNNGRLKTVRKNADISLQDMAFLLDTDVSNLSKYERGIKLGSLKIFLGYFIITGAPLHDVVKHHIEQLVISIRERAETRIQLLEQAWQTPKAELRIDKLFEVLDHLRRFNRTKDDKENDN
jgi:transcriptional regulator with XRE-family HTH domain